MEINEIKKVLIIKLCCLGDIVQATPAIRAVRTAGAEVHFLCIPWVSELVDMVPFISKKFVVNMKSPASIAENISKLRAEKYDLIMNFHRDRKAHLFAALLGAKFRAGFDWKGKGMFLTHKFPFDSSVHEGLRYLRIAEGMGFKRQGDYTELRGVSALREGGAFKAGFFPGGGVNPGTVMPTKRWPVQRFFELAGLLQEKNAELYVFGGETDEDVLLQFQAPNSKFQVIKTNTLKEFVDKVSQMSVFVAGDTGPLHITSALGVPCVGLFGPSSADLVGAKGKKTRNIWGRTDCAPCYEPETVHNRKFLECRDNVCMQSITAEQVKNEIDEITVVVDDARK